MKLVHLVQHVFILHKLWVEHKGHKGTEATKIASMLLVVSVSERSILERQL
jgi:hypothetical protein